MSRTMAPVDEQLRVLMSGVDYGDEQLRERFSSELKGLLEQDRPLRVYLGIDPTATSLTLGHTVPLRKLRQFQEFGHHTVLLIGDMTALVGDPSDKNALRPKLTQEEIQANEATYFEQAAVILDAGKTELRHNSEWLGKLDFAEILDLLSKFTVAEMLRRDNFRKRFDAGDAIYLHEFLYALMQGYDAYALECDVQVGGTEQLFNLMAGRKIQEDAGQKPHVPVTMPILVGLDGKERMSKSKGNHIGVHDAPEEQYGKVMSLPDEVLGDFYTLATNVDRGEVEGIIAGLGDGSRNPMEQKKHLARTIVTELHGDAAGSAAEEHFERTVQRKETPDDMPEWNLPEGAALLDVIVDGGLAPSRREARRLVEQGAVSLDGEVANLDTAPGKGTVLQVGKRRWLRLV
ncbi:MAG: tyrosine--tRNA ligase [Dehalococcoidia bacterium]|nr:tyrosine--tRNA ligase [Dehalococcoidia bacterium]